MAEAPTPIIPSPRNGVGASPFLNQPSAPPIGGAWLDLFALPRISFAIPTLTVQAFCKSRIGEIWPSHLKICLPTERIGDQLGLLLAMIGQQRQAIHELIEIIEGIPSVAQAKLSAVVERLDVIPEGVEP